MTTAAATVVTAPPAPVAAPREESRTGRPRGGGGWRRGAVTVAFMLPAAVLLGAIVGYPLIATVIRSFYDRGGSNFIGLDNYRTMFGTADILIAIRNNAIWVIVFPFFVSFFGLVFAVLTERIRWSTAFKVVVFMPMAISLFASGVIWRIVYETDPSRGVINAVVGSVANAVHPVGLYPEAAPISGMDTTARSDGSFLSTATVQPGGTVMLGLTRIPLSQVPPGAQPAHPPSGVSGDITGIVWRDFSPRGHLGVVDPGELGLPEAHVDLVNASGSTVASATTDSSGAFRFSGVGSGSYRVALDSQNFRTPFAGVNWLGPQSLTPTSGLGETGQALLSVPLVTLSAIVAMLWIWAGFAMVVIGAGLAALNREVLEAARMDGATEWQTFRYVTFPLLLPVLIVVFMTMIINVLKIFDIILAISPDSSLQQANVIALKMWQIGFNSNDFGLGSAVAVLLFLLVIPVMAVNIRRIRA